jgi:P27 family predicted phage terminase small subunit
MRKAEKLGPEVRGLRPFLESKRKTPQFDVATEPPECPQHLDELARQEFEKLAKVLVRRRSLNAEDVMSLSNLCQAWSTLVKAQTKLNETGLILKAPSGYIQQNPLVGIINTYTDVVTRLSVKFGLTPKARLRMPLESDNG